MPAAKRRLHFTALRAFALALWCTIRDGGALKDLPSMYLRRPQRRAFTLVELLVVLGIITVLLAMLLPALRIAREQANGIKCAASLRQMYAAVSMYGNDHRGYLPAARFWDNRGGSA